MVRFLLGSISGEGRRVVNSTWWLWNTQGTLHLSTFGSAITPMLPKRTFIRLQRIGIGSPKMKNLSSGAFSSGKTIKKRRLFVKVSTERPLSSGKRITTGRKELKPSSIERNKPLASLVNCYHDLSILPGLEDHL
ncbi:hypothetical protein L3X38_007232 [Prunus dulcis]|uniref:Uncharacterized protein n=1 Tax=Prunus dulcis TaxID=3755 RepID=A0AAD4ZU39_PRUDU|nr:hypothetical protein L3X38_007232 [Prunus dulcis]